MSNLQGIRAATRLMAAVALSSLVAFGVSAQTVRYIHTDSLGSIVLATDNGRNIVERGEYEPYGSVTGSLAANRPGYTGHVMDAANGMTYMQQRYYDQQLGRFVSVDQVAPDKISGNGFNRYRYAANNPYTFKDPDGRQECRSCEVSYGAAVGYMLRNQPEKMRIWASGEAAATTAGGGAEEGATIGNAVGEFVDTGNISKQAVTTLATVTVIGVLTHGKGKLGPLRGPSPRINIGQQGKHQIGHNNFIQGRSILTGDAQELGRYAGTGQQVGKLPVGAPGSKERVNFGQEVGKYVDEFGNESVTTNGIIHYGKDGIHIVPSRPDP
ncbi:polymorphic toxin type 50 domain-containing protein [Xanthomonas sacchari]|uniref:polymorphic toxin type 50 domain-containing protein n=1 Tax=Xanthomonas sacchari TaxID=56458 RepID=UPI00299F8520|nr:polymorphic toxin type 50 domain-containing protein [Xanthomonas sacchari]MCW0369065.1 hypothetical protein [Xanthomonas sacchari]